MNALRLLAALPLLLAAACAGRAGSPADIDDDEGGLTALVCPTEAVAACEGDIAGTWELVEVCAPDDEPLSGPCEAAFADTPGCEGDADTALCVQRYLGTLALDATGSGTLTTSVFLDRTETLSAACVSAAAEIEDPAAACESFVRDTTSCTFADDTCTCFAAFPGEGEETLPVTFAADGASYHLEGVGADPADGPACASDDGLVLGGVVGWPAWIFTRE